MKERRKRLLLALPMLLIMIVIFSFSSQPSAQSNASSDFVVDHLIQIIEGVEQKLGIESTEPVLDQRGMEVMTFLVRKLAHTFEYAVLGISICIFLCSDQRSSKKCFWMALGIGFAYACTDEFHQWFVPGRSCEFRDVLIDSNGVFLGVLASLFVRHRRRKRRLRKEASKFT